MNTMPRQFTGEKTVGGYAQGAVDEFNRLCPEGAAVIVHRDNGEDFRTVTRSEAFVANSGVAVVFVRGIASYYALSHVDIVEHA